jgi:hypothetical protein
MCEILELVLELLLNVAGYVLEAMAEIWLGDLSWPDTRGSRIFWGVALVLIGGLIWWELR